MLLPHVGHLKRTHAHELQTPFLCYVIDPLKGPYLSTVFKSTTSSLSDNITIVRCLFILVSLQRPIESTTIPACCWVIEGVWFLHCSLSAKGVTRQQRRQKYRIKKICSARTISLGTKIQRQKKAMLLCSVEMGGLYVNPYLSTAVFFFSRQKTISAHSPIFYTAT